MRPSWVRCGYAGTHPAPHRRYDRGPVRIPVQGPAEGAIAAGGGLSVVPARDRDAFGSRAAG